MKQTRNEWEEKEKEICKLQPFIRKNGKKLTFQ